MLYTLLHPIFLEPIVAPGLGRVIRKSAGEIEISWDTVVKEEEPVTGYIVRYRPVVSNQRRRRNTEDLATLIETNQTSHVVTGLNPGISYAISVAAKNRAGIGPYSEDIVVGSKHVQTSCTNVNCSSFLL